MEIVANPNSLQPLLCALSRVVRSEALSCWVSLEALGCFSGFSKVKSVLAIQLWKGWFSTQVISACSWFVFDVSGLLLCSAPSQADFNNNTSIFLGTSGPGPQQSSGHRGTQGFYAHTLLMVGVFSLKPTVLTQKRLDLMSSQVQIFPHYLIAVYWTQLKPKCPN